MLPLSPTSIGRPEASRAASLFSQTASPLALSPALYFSYDAVLLRRFQLRDHIEQEKKEQARLLKEQVEDREADLEEFRLFQATQYSRRLPPPTFLPPPPPPPPPTAPPRRCRHRKRHIPQPPLRPPPKFDNDDESNLSNEDESTALEVDEDEFQLCLSPPGSALSSLVRIADSNILRYLYLSLTRLHTSCV